MRRGRKRQCDTPHGRREGAQGGEGAKEDTNEDQYRRTRRETIARTIREPSPLVLVLMRVCSTVLLVVCLMLWLMRVLMLPRERGLSP